MTENESEAVFGPAARERQAGAVTTAEPDAKHCTATTKAGEPCRGYAIKGHTTCAGHSGKGFGANPQAAQAKQAASRRKKANERQEVIERAKTLKAAGVRGALALALGEEVESAPPFDL